MVVKTKSLGTRSITYLSFRRAESASGTSLTGLRLLLLIGLHFPWRFHPKALTDPHVNLSIHPARATERRLPPSAYLQKAA